MSTKAVGQQSSKRATERGRKSPGGSGQDSFPFLSEGVAEQFHGDGPAALGGQLSPEACESRRLVGRLEGRLGALLVQFRNLDLEPAHLEDYLGRLESLSIAVSGDAEVARCRADARERYEARSRAKITRLGGMR